MTPADIEDALREIELKALGQLGPEWVRTRSTGELAMLSKRYLGKYAALNLERLPMATEEDTERYCRLSRLGTAYIVVAALTWQELQDRK